MSQDPRVLQSQRAIIEASIQVLLRNPDAGMSEIALAAGIGRATLYRHFESKDLLVQYLARQCLEETDELMAPLKQQGLRGRAAIEAAIDVLLPMADRFKFLLSLWDIASGNKKVRAVYQRQLDELADLVGQAKQDGDIQADVSDAWVVSVFDSLLYAGWLMVRRGEMSPRQAADGFKRTFFHGLG